MAPAIDEWDPLLNVTSFENTGYGDVPSFFDQIMVPDPDFNGADNTMLPPDISNLFSDQDWFGEMDIFGTDFVPTMDEALAIPPWPSPSTAIPNEIVQAETSYGQALSRSEHARKRHAIYQQSPWLWYPEKRQNAFSEHSSIQLDEIKLYSASSPHQPFAEASIIPDKLSMKSRDRIFELILKTAKSRVSMASFPSAELLEVLMKMGIAKRLETDAWIHPHLFHSESARPELLTALVAAGCVCFGVKAISRTGLVLLEIVRQALNKSVEDDNSAIRDLQYLQATMLWLDVCAFCGFKRKMEIAESHLQPLVTALRRFGKFDSVAYPVIIPAASDTTEETEEKWRRWVEVQSYTRLVHHLLEHDLLITMTKHRNPLISYAELTLPLPANRELWLAPSAEMWRTAYLAKTHGVRQQRVSVRSLLTDGDLVNCLPPDIDARLAATTYLYGLTAQVWEHQQQSTVLNGAHGTSDASATLWLQSRHQKLCQLLQATSPGLATTSPTTKLFQDFLLSTLHVSLDDVIRFAGKCGEEEAHRAYQALQSWSTSKQARTAIWHAAQVIRWAKVTPPYQLRGCDSFLTYHASMILWAYAMMQRDAARRTARSSPQPGGPIERDTVSSLMANGKLPIVFLDGPKTADTDAFVHLNSGRPCLQLSASKQNPTAAPLLGDLKNPQSIMAVCVEVLERNAPSEERAGKPQMIKCLCDLMSELGSLR
ncbi:hypothetical protein LTR86_000663 [Recurvomyces mirabilis]|nr:hypothetical protein LTR86_000663 [Recurvomyces mirabilis]